MSRKTPRKSMREIRLEERTRGFYECLHYFEYAFRKRFWESMHKDPKTGLNVGDETSYWMMEVIMKAGADFAPTNREYSDMRYQRVTGKDPNEE